MSPLLKNLLTLLTQCDTLQGPPAKCRIVSRVSAGKPPHQGRGEKLALQRLGKNGERRDLTYGELLELSNRFANLLPLYVVRPHQVFGAETAFAETARLIKVSALIR